jgi:hypothetical protein
MFFSGFLWIRKVSFRIFSVTTQIIFFDHFFIGYYFKR